MYEADSAPEQLPSIDKAPQKNISGHGIGGGFNAAYRDAGMDGRGMRIWTAKYDQNHPQPL